ncbi:lipopolysaccharide biosynthesis protein [Hyphomicrobium sp. CS1GBMeth3]|uniref:lipopolysaccharide biosynthesis protein n=1 Tax=Hyphomicrobium sp. CS1GBMeth3 TaxID=1892845 RepID=UPI0009302848|nr:lipopolysaccharide biosynthesis protein [Hyphomicrobium sp. CS1GBMeth3]
MTGIRRSFALASADRYFAVILNFVTLLVTARLLTPAEFGVAVIGLAVLGLAETLHDFGGSAYIVQVKDLTPARLHAVFTVTFFLTVSVAALLFFMAGPLAEFYDTPGLKAFMQVASACFLLGPFVSPVHALMRRNFEFGKMAVLSAASIVVNTGVTITLALLGYSYMSFAWGSLMGGIVYLALCWWWGPQERVYRLTFAEWRDVSAYGIYDSLKKLLYYAWEAVPLLAFGKTLGADGLGLYQRAFSVSRLPEKTMLAGLAPVLLPAFSQHAREGRDLKIGFLRSIEHTTVFFWPALVFIIILAGPIVDVLLGHQWVAVVPIVQIISAAFLLQLPTSIVNSVQIAVGAVRDSFVLALVTIPASIAVQVFASLYGLEMAAASLLITGPFCLLISLVMVRARVPFAWEELWASLWRSGVVTLFSALGPAAVAIACGGTHQVTIAAGAIGLLTAPVGWLVGLYVARHPMLEEVRRAFDYVLARLSAKVPERTPSEDIKR